MSFHVIRERKHILLVDSLFTGRDQGGYRQEEGYLEHDQ
jgi:hypothetical protein